MVIWGDVAYRKGCLFSPEYWRKYFNVDFQSDAEQTGPQKPKKPKKEKKRKKNKQNLPK